VLAGFEGTRARSDEVQALADLGVGGFIVFARNVDSPVQVHTLLEDLCALCEGRKLLLAVDQEGGRVARLRSPLTVWPAMATLGERDDEGLTEQVGRAIGAELLAVGFNVNFAPVLDVRCTDTTIAIGDRCLSDDPQRVARLGRALVTGLQSAGIMACAKHFPGHGHVAEDSHHSLPVCPLDGPALRRDHLPPFAAAIEAGVGAVMTAHVVYPGLGSNEAATLSAPILGDLLREEMGFDGVLFTDDLGMGAVTAHGSIGEAAVAAVRAGADGLLVCRHLDAVREVVAALHSAAAAEPEFAARCERSLARLRAAASRFPRRPVATDRLAHALGAPAHQAIAARLQAGTASPGQDPTQGHDDPTQGHDDPTQGHDDPTQDHDDPSQGQGERG
jgi:beta-N-acetylhexosaminidase